MAREFVTVSRDERTYVPKDWKDEKGEPEKGALTFKFIPLSVRQLANFQDSSSRMSLNSSTLLLGNAGVHIDVFKMAISGWDNYLVDKEAVVYKKDGTGVKESLVEPLPLDIIEEVASHILQVSKFPEDNKKK